MLACCPLQAVLWSVKFVHIEHEQGCGCQQRPSLAAFAMSALTGVCVEQRWHVACTPRSIRGLPNAPVGVNLFFFFCLAVPEFAYNILYWRFCFGRYLPRLDPCTVIVIILQTAHILPCLLRCATLTSQHKMSYIQNNNSYYSIVVILCPSIQLRKI